jgi:hypothetical protein
LLALLIEHLHESADADRREERDDQDRDSTTQNRFGG